MTTNADLADLDRDELLIELFRARDEISALRAQVVRLQRQQKETVVTERQGVFQMSMNVLMVSGAPDNRRCRTVPLEAVLNKSFNRMDEREADTPMVFGAGQHDLSRLSIDHGRLSEFSVGSSDNASVSGLASNAGDDLGRRSGSSNPSPGRTAGRPAPLTINPRPKLDPNAIVSSQTLYSFTRMYAGRPGSPQSNYATSISQYIIESFVRRNDFAHEENPQQMEAFGRTLLQLCGEMENILRDEPRHVSVCSPVYTFGDIHGNFRDLHYFLTTLMNFEDMRFVPYNLLFLGDYVDRGEFSVEVVAFLFALKVLSPSKVTLLRGNHEDTLVNGDMNMYRETSFRSQCHALFGQVLGQEIWSRCNRVFSFLPLTANIDKKIFCTHGGLPRYQGGEDNRMEMLLRNDFPRMETFFQIPDDDTEFSAACRQVASDVCWSDPAENEDDTNEFGFGPNPRGNGVILFGSRAVDKFLADFGYEYIFRAHQEKSDGVKVSKNARVLTIFSTSAYVGHQNGAGVVFVGDNRIRLIIKLPDPE